jgi:hypothetical protein
MTPLAKLQLLGPLVLFVVVLAAEAATYALAAAPTSEMLWYLNVKPFLIFQRSHYLFSDWTSIPGGQLLLVALPIFLIACYGYMRRRALALALACNLSLAYVAFLAAASNVIEKGASLQASVVFVAIPSGPSLYTLSLVLGCSLLSVVASHLFYFGAVRGVAGRI